MKPIYKYISVFLIIILTFAMTAFICTAASPANDIADSENFNMLGVVIAILTAVVVIIVIIILVPKDKSKRK